MPTTQQYIAAKGDPDLLARLIAKAEMLGISDPSGWVQAHLTAIMQQSIGEDSTIVTVHAYAKGARDEYLAAIPPAPGADLGAVTDAHLETAIQAVQNAPTP